MLNEFASAVEQTLTQWLGYTPTLNEMILIPMVPVFAGSFLLEWFTVRRRTGSWSAGRGERFYWRETLANFSLGAGYYVSGALMNLLFVAAAFTVAWEYRFFTVPVNAWTVVLAFFVQEFCYYVFHRTSHRVRWFWCQHVSHHTGVVMNMSTAARQSILNGVVGTWLFYLPAVLLGFSPEIILGLLAANLSFQWFVHTESVGKLHPWLEWWFNTPSNHRVHHGRNPKYIDKNYGGVIMLYDHLFGTYQAEQEAVEYGIVRQIKSHNWFVLNMHEMVDMFRDIMAPGPVSERLKHLWKPPEWNRAGHAAIHTWPVEEANPDHPVDPPMPRAPVPTGCGETTG